MSVDGGDSWWTSWDNPHERVSDVNGFVELDDGTLFACLTNSSDYHIGVIRSIDHGLSWESVGLDENYLISFAKSPDGTVYAGCDGYNNDEDVGVFKTEDNGETWEMLNGDFRVNSIVIDDNDNVTLPISTFKDCIVLMTVAIISITSVLAWIIFRQAYPYCPMAICYHTSITALSSLERCLSAVSQFTRILNLM
jgi:hypothetical protein